MRGSRSTSIFVHVLFLLSLALLNAVSAPRTQAQQHDDLTSQDTTHAIDIFRQGNATEAINQLLAIVQKHPEDSEAWYYLGLAYKSLGSVGSSRPAFEHVVRLRPNSADAHAKLAFALIFADEPKKALAIAQRALELGDQSVESHYTIAEASLRTGANTKAIEEAETVLKISPNFTAALITRSFAQSNLKLYSEAAASLEQLLALTPGDIDAESWRGQIEELRRIDPPPNSGSPILSGKEVTLKARVLSKPEPMYSEEARKVGLSGTVVLRAVFTADGEVKHVLITRALGYGLTTNAIRAARKIRFSPAMKDGAPVSMHIQLEYNFNLY